ncbi:hypothetical protein RM553_06225 [Zunongwangia sp. F363]|uniref:CarboxypepD_reg-like domain-containing protein n=1 Tax=Autumnicola tepida TaxID=3075595 RepID=A0ABU3C7V8_9FLAO|nr:hypothetical protein [Zunongwangia sp. F363]MDT0642425.1 hypothetical protein [Zunongwangia sp. F363]
MLKNLLLAFLFISSFSAFSQDPVQLKGKIINDSLQGAFINIINKTLKTGTINSSSGEFQIKVRENDTLLFSSIQYEKLEIAVTPLLMESGYLEVKLIPGVNVLDEVKISNITLSGDLGADIGSMDNYTISDFGIPNLNREPITAAERRLHTASSWNPGFTGSGGAVGLDPLLNAISGRTKKLKKIVANEKLQGLVEQGIAAFPVNFFVKDLKIPEEQIVNFVYYCAENHQLKYLLKDEKRLDLLEFYQKYAVEFLKLRASE